MQSSVSIATDGSRTAKSSEPALVGKENEKAPGLAPTPAATVAADASEKDPFLVQIDKNDPGHAMVCVSHLLSLWLTVIHSRLWATPV